MVYIQKGLTFGYTTQVLNQGNQYRTNTGYTGWYVYWYRNINVSYQFKNRPCTGHTSQFRAIQASTEHTGQYRKKFFFFLSFVIFEFLLGQNSNLFTLTY